MRVCERERMSICGVCVCVCSCAPRSACEVVSSKFLLAAWLVSSLFRLQHFLTFEFFFGTDLLCSDLQVKMEQFRTVVHCATAVVAVCCCFYCCGFATTLSCMLE